MSSLYARDCEALQRLASIISRHESAEILQRRFEFMRDAISRHMWDEDIGLFSNMNAISLQFVRQHSPTSFYPLIAGIADHHQLHLMLHRHLLNESRFCVVEEPHNNCSFALPSTPFDDPAFQDQQYWRGRIWAPMVQLVYTGLQRYRHIHLADYARKVVNNSQI